MQIVEKADFLKLTFSAEFLSRFAAGITFKKSWTVRFNTDEVVFFGARNLSIERLTIAQLEATKRIVTGARLEDLCEYLTAPEVAEMISYLDLHNLIRPVYQNEFIGTAWEKQVEFFADFVDEPNDPQRRLMRTSVCVVGVGGTGNASIQQLVCAGIQKFILIDDDLVETGNFNRQFCFRSEDIGRSKVAAMKDYILERNPAAQVEIFCEQVKSSADLDRLLTGDLKPDIIVGCADTPPIAIQTFILEYCIKHDVICTFGGLAIHHGLVGPILTEKSHQERYLVHRQEQLQIISRLTAAQSGTGIPTGSICYLPTTIASLVIGDLIDLITGIKQPPSLNTVWRYDPYTKSTVREQQY